MNHLIRVLHRRTWTQLAGAALLLLVSGAALSAAKPDDDPESIEVWQKVRASLFQQRTILPARNGEVVLTAPTRAEDAAVVPISIQTRLPQTAAEHVAKLYLLIDANPSPISAIFTLTPQSGRADIETRVRVDEYTFVRAIAETNSGKLYMTTRFVKASGGCSAPPTKDAQAARAMLGKMKFRVDGDVVPNKPVLAQLMISHPNHSGLAMDQFTRQFTPPHFVRSVKVSYGGKPVMSADVDFSISENPNFRFYFVPTAAGELKAEIVDSQEQKFESVLPVQPSTSG